MRDAINQATRESKVPLLSVVFGERGGGPVSGGSTEFAYPESAARALAGAARLYEWRMGSPGEPQAPSGARPGDAAELLAGAAAGGERWLDDGERT